MGVCSLCWIIAEGKWLGRGLIAGFIIKSLFSAGLHYYNWCNEQLSHHIISVHSGTLAFITSCGPFMADDYKVSFFFFLFQETRIRASEKDPQSKVQQICISNQYGGEEVTHILTAESREDTHRWMEAFWQHFYDMSKCMFLHVHLYFYQSCLTRGEDEQL